MKIANIATVPKHPNVNPIFTGPDVTRQALAPESRDHDVAIVNFGKGVRNRLHIHDSDQILIVTSGRGIVATERDQREVSVGDVVFFPAGEKHWHGATADSEFSHIYVTRAGSKTTPAE